MPLFCPRKLSQVLGRREGARAGGLRPSEHAWYFIQTESFLQLPRRCLVLLVIVRHHDGTHGSDVDSGPDDMPVDTSLLLVFDDKTGVPLQPEMSLQRSDGNVPLPLREGFVFPGVDVRVVEVILAERADRDGFHLPECIRDIRCREIMYPAQRHALVVLAIRKMLRKKYAVAARTAVNDHEAVFPKPA
jgi:hypothetical protein